MTNTSDLRTSRTGWLFSFLRREIPEPPPATTPDGAFPTAQTKHLQIKGYRPEIDGLRALAVVPVVLFHAGLGFPGGFVGVDIFFVISGFLITSLIHKELERGTFSLVNFWARRARRIVPASLALTFAVLVAGWFLLLPPDYRALGKSAASQAAFSSNIYFWLKVNYFAPAVETLPLLHTWSLAVEEQFYVFFPLLLLLCYRSAFLRRRGALIGLFAAGFLVSLACSIYEVSISHWHLAASAAFYLLPTRAWELLTGSLLAIFPASWTPLRKGVREAVSGAGLLAILFAIFYYDHDTPFPGMAALPPCLGAGLIIWSNGSEADANHAGRTALTAVGRLLASPLPVFIGLISYSLYLWHWPLLAFSCYRVIVPLSLPYRVSMVALAFVLATLSWWLIEGPFRKRQVLPSRTGVLCFAACGLAASFLLGSAIYYFQGFRSRFSKQVDVYADASLEHAPLISADTKEVLSGHLPRFGADRPGAEPLLFVWGDSHAAAALPAIDLYCKRHGISGIAAMYASTSPVLDYFTYAAHSLNEKAIPFGHAVFDYIQKNKIPNVILISHWKRDLLADPGKFEAALIHTIEAFRPTGVKLYIMMQVPHQPIDVPRRLAFDAEAPNRAVEWRETVSEHHTEQAVFYRVAAKYASSNCVFIDPATAFLDPDGVHYDVVRDGRCLYCDEHHLSVFGSTDVLEPFFEKVLAFP